MKFITEDDLRDIYRKEPFTNYEIEFGTKITPGARQFLADRQINIIDGGRGSKTQKDGTIKKKPLKQKERKTNRLCSRITSVEALFLETAEELLDRDVLLAQKVVSFKKSFTEIRNTLASGRTCEKMKCECCSGICEDNFSEDLGDCFEITEFHIQLGKGKEIIRLHKLRCALHELSLDLSEFYEEYDEEKSQHEDISERINQMINNLSQMICSIAGGEKCQRKL